MSEAPKLTCEVLRITSEGATLLADEALRLAGEREVHGAVAVFDSGGLLRALRTTEGVKRANVKLAQLKAQTVVATGISNSLLRARMHERGQDRADFADAIGSGMQGGVAVYSTADLTEFVAACGFSGGTPQQDEAFLLEAAIRLGLCTDLSS